MSKTERIKELLGFVKSIIIALLVAIFGMSSYLFLNFDKIHFIRIAIVTVVIILTIMVIGILIKILFKKLKELEDL